LLFFFGNITEICSVGLVLLTELILSCGGTAKRLC